MKIPFLSLGAFEMLKEHKPDIFHCEITSVLSNNQTKTVRAGCKASVIHDH